MKQPELGKKISELRKEKGLTQEELVELCNINVRTIQRIESGEVTPRSYTLKMILKVLDYDFDEIKIDVENTLSFSKKHIKIITLAFWFGIVYTIVDSLCISLDIIREFDIKDIAEKNYFKPLYFTSYFVAILSSLFFHSGFYVIGKLFKSTLLKVSSILLFIVSICCYVFALFLYDSTEFIQSIYGVSVLIFFGCTGVPFGIGILQLNRHIGSYATITGIFTIILYATMLTVILVFMSVFLILPVMILQLILLYKAKEYLQNG